MEISGHKILVTGGSSGIGLELAREFLVRGNRVAVCGRDSQKLSEAREALKEVEIIQFDLGSHISVSSLALEAKERLGGLSILVNNAGVQMNYSFISAAIDQIVEDVSREIQINLTSIISLTSACLPFLREHHSAAVVNVSSALAITPKASAPVYCATKAAVHSFTQALRYQFEESLPNVQVFELMPPLVETKMTQGRGGGKISPRQVAAECLRGMERDRREIRVGKAKTLGVLYRLAPSVATRILKGS